MDSRRYVPLTDGERVRRLTKTIGDVRCIKADEKDKPWPLPKGATEPGPCVPRPDLLGKRGY